MDKNKNQQDFLRLTVMEQAPTHLAPKLKLGSQMLAPDGSLTPALSQRERVIQPVRCATFTVTLLSASLILTATPDAVLAQTGDLPLPPGQVILGPVMRRDGTSVASIATGADANLYIKSTPPTESYLPGALAQAVYTSEPTQYVRFYTNGLTNPVGGFIVGSNAVRGLTAEQVRDRLALPYLPDSLTLVQAPKGTCMLVGTAAPILGNFSANPPSIPTAGPWGQGGAFQESLIGRNANSSDCGNAQFLDSSSYINRQSIGAHALSYLPRAGFGNAGRVGAALDAAIPPALFTDMDGVYNRLDVLNTGDPSALRDALKQLDGEAYADAATVDIIAARMFQRVVHDQMRLARSAGGLADKIAVGALNGTLDDSLNAASIRPWLTGFGGGGGLGGNGDTHGLSYNAQGVAGGLDHRFGSAFLAGLALGYTHSNFNTQGLSGNGSVDSFSAQTYASYAPGSWYLDGQLGYAYNQAMLSHSIVFSDLARVASGNPNSNQFQSSVEAGYHFALDSRTVLTPLIAIQGIVNVQDRFNESGAGAINLQVQRHTNASAQSILGSELSHGLSVGLASPLLLTARAGWGHDFADVARSNTAGFEGALSALFTVNGARAPRDQGLIGFGASLKLKQADLFLRYDGALAAQSSLHTGSAGLSFAF